MSAEAGRLLPPVRATRAGRLADYVAAMFPIWQYAPFALSMFATVYLGAQALAGADELLLRPRAAAGAASALLFLLLMRVYDEIKDAAHDRRMAAAGDPRYRHRPIVTGHVTEADLFALRRTLQVALLLLNLVYLPGWAFAGFLLTFGVTWLSSRWFFWPAISRHLLLAFATHNPIALVFALYAYTCLLADRPELQAGAWLPALLALVWLPLAAWEAARKVRAPQDETAYETYSKALGPTGAGLAPAFFALLGALCMAWLAPQAGLPLLLPLIHGAVTLVAVAASLRYVFTRSRAAARLSPWYDAWCAATGIGWVLALMATHPVLRG